MLNCPIDTSSKGILFSGSAVNDYRSVLLMRTRGQYSMARCLLCGGGARCLLCGGASRCLLCGGGARCLLFDGGVRCLLCGGGARCLLFDGEVRCFLCGDGARCLLFDGGVRCLLFDGGSRCCAMVGRAVCCSVVRRAARCAVLRWFGVQFVVLLSGRAVSFRSCFDGLVGLLNKLHSRTDAIILRSDGVFPDPIRRWAGALRPIVFWKNNYWTDSRCDDI